MNYAFINSVIKIYYITNSFYKKSEDSFCVKCIFPLLQWKLVVYYYKTYNLQKMLTRHLIIEFRNNCGNLKFKTRWWTDLLMLEKGSREPKFLFACSLKHANGKSGLTHLWPGPELSPTSRLTRITHLRPVPELSLSNYCHKMLNSANEFHKE